MQKLSPKQALAAQLLAAGHTGRATAKAVGCAPETICAWKHQDDFAEHINDLKREFTDAGRDAIRAAIASAVQSLASLSTTAANEEVRRKAAMDILKLSGLDGTHLYQWGVENSPAKEVEGFEPYPDIINGLSRSSY